MTMTNKQDYSQNVDLKPPAALIPEATIEGQTDQPQEMTPEQKRAVIGAVVALVILVGLIVGGIVALALSPADVAAKVRDIFIILMAILSLLIGLALVILIVQLARLTNLLQNELRPIIDSMNETVSHLRGTSIFLSDNLAEPVIKLNEYLAGISQLINATGLRRKSNRTKDKTTKGE